jgi:TetR/AcrR family transcriptional repressor of nem operon
MLLKLHIRPALAELGITKRIGWHSFRHGLGARVSSVSESISRYLTPGHRDNPGSGCFMAALGGDMPRQGELARNSFTRIVKGAAARLARKLPVGTSRKRKDEMLAVVASMVGAMILARAVDDEEFADHILSVA